MNLIRVISKLLIVFSSIFLLLLISCKDNSRNSKPKVSREDILKANKYLVEKDKELIENYIKGKNIVAAQQNGAGLYYKIVGDPQGPVVKTNDIVELRYKVSLLDGTICYSSDKNGIKVFRVGSGGVESGLEQAVLLMRPGQSGLFIMPPHLAHGITGDNNKIPPRSIIIYEIEMLTIKR